MPEIPLLNCFDDLMHPKYIKKILQIKSSKIQLLLAGLDKTKERVMMKRVGTRTSRTSGGTP